MCRFNSWLGTACLLAIVAYAVPTLLADDPNGFTYDPNGPDMKFRRSASWGICEGLSEDVTYTKDLTQYGPNVLGNSWDHNDYCDFWLHDPCPNGEGIYNTILDGEMENCAGLAGARQTIAFRTHSAADLYYWLELDWSSQPYWGYGFGSWIHIDNLHLPFEVTADGKIRVVSFRVVAECTISDECDSPMNSVTSLADYYCGAKWAVTSWESLACIDCNESDDDQGWDFDIDKGGYTFQAEYGVDPDARIWVRPFDCSDPARQCEAGLDADHYFLVFLRYYQGEWCPGDADGDGAVGSSDLGLVLGAYDTQLCPPDANYNPDADLDGDGDVDHADLAILLANWDNTCD